MARILLTIDIHDPSRGGASEFVSSLASFLTAQAHQVGVACHRPRHEQEDYQLVLPVHEVQSFSPYAQAAHLQERVDKERWDLIHDTGGCLLSSDIYHPLMGSRLHNEFRQWKAMPLKKTITHIRHTQPWNWARLQRSQCRNHRVLVACSRRVARDFAHFNVATHAVIHNGATLPRLAEQAEVNRLRLELKVGSRLLVLLTSNNHYLKGVMQVLQAVRIMTESERRDMLVVIAGRNEDTAFQRFLTANKLQGCCRLVDWVADIDLYYRAADIFLHPTFHDAGSLSTLKALAAGTAVVTTRWDGSADFIENGRDGFVLNSNSPVEIMEALRALRSPQLRQELGDRAVRLRERVHRQVCFNRINELYRGMLA